MATPIPYFTFNNGVKIPSVGMGCWMGSPGGGEAVEKMVKDSLKVGYRHIDTAQNEDHVGKGIRESGIPREEIFVVSKLPTHHHHKVRDSFEESLKALDIGYIDLYLMHWPQAHAEDGKHIPYGDKPTIVDTWKDMEKLLETGKVKSIGLSNFSIKTLEELLPHVSVVPATNQVELHPCLPWFELQKYCEAKGILLTAYSPLGRPIKGEPKPVFFTDAGIAAVADKHSATSAQVVISWIVKRGIVAIPKSENVERMKQNITLVDLSAEDMVAVDGIHKLPNAHRSLLAYHAKAVDNNVFGWTYEQLGWPMKQGGFVVD
ncbi:Aldo/keto reductase [Amylocystis lapponica]|nr:Aldo/keto reductase [Amylocystis lapponica]